MTNPLNSLLRPPRPDGPHYRWGYVTSVSPTLQVVLDTETDPIQKPSTLVDLSPGDRVFVLMESLRSTVLGRVPTPDPPVAAPSVQILVTGSSGTTSATFTKLGTSRSVTLDHPQYCLITMHGFILGGSGTSMRAQLAWLGATTGDSYTLHGGNWSGCLSGLANSTRDDATLTFGLLLNAGETFFQVQALRDSGTGTPTIADVSLSVVPLRNA